MKSTEQLISLTSALDDAGVGQNSIGLVSPCSSCTNYRSSDQEGQPACPRRLWAARAEALSLSQTSDAPPEYLLRKARDPEATGFENPVAWPEGNSRVVWVAVIEENRALLADNGTVVNPSLLDPGFDTNRIQCRPLPYVPSSREADYYAGGQLKERDFVFVQSVRFRQSDATQIGDTPLKIGGVCQKITPMQKATVTPAKMSVNARGM